MGGGGDPSQNVHQFHEKMVLFIIITENTDIVKVSTVFIKHLNYEEVGGPLPKTPDQPDKDRNYGI